MIVSLMNVFYVNIINYYRGKCKTDGGEILRVYAACPSFFPKKSADPGQHRKNFRNLTDQSS
ncbi:MAG: hypothetical protein BHW37_01020 [Firmicutes bacterium CAG:272_52_7]|nr:MAG: hypothetical protein BHW37_01020 [Firmicutes bacterium CAG:272_52_7]